MPLREAKAALRAEMRAVRKARGPLERAAAGEAAAARLAALLDQLPAGPVALFHALPEEIDTAPAFRVVAARGRSVLLPRQAGKNRALEFHAFRPGDPLLPGPYGVLEPIAAAPRLEPAVLVLPLLAFDRAGARLGYGAGFYDRTIRELHARGRRPPVIGFAFSFQEVARVPTGPCDARLECVVTEREVIRCAAAAVEAADPASER
ncbi:MAG: 5-formyltetrahydrofolate cyclo-ligase [Geminicoccaceae bacterium]|nr:5-formyltetrahydrofolate cyclo-ligase [Geminicoccaceae bacterium]